MTRNSAPVLKVDAVDIDIYISSHSKLELAWAANKWLWIISTIGLFKKIVIVLMS